jgi:tRNA pseudouridine38-40 synthase
MRSLRSTIAYDGTHFAGWQRQPGQRTVQRAFEETLQKITGEATCVTASGRTDAGVHALGQVVGFNTHCMYEPDVLVKALNAQLPEDIVVFDVATAPDDFDPIRDAVRKRYRYVLHDGRIPNIFDRQFSWHIWQELDVAAMQHAAKLLEGKHDFASFETGGSSRLTSVRTVYEVLVERQGCEYTDRVVIEVEADGFLYNMVRNIVGTLVQVGRGRRPIEWVSEVLTALDRQAAGQVAPAQGLFLMWVKYDC